MSKRKRQGSQKKPRVVSTIVKVELGVKPLLGAQRMVIVNRDRSLVVRDYANKAIIDKMEGHARRYFEAEYNQLTTEFTLTNPLPEQDWQ